MKEIIIEKNESNQRLDRFLKKYFNKASNSFIYKMIRKKNIKVNGLRAHADAILFEGDRIQLYLSDETINKFREKKKIILSDHMPNVIYEDENIILLNKESGLLSHSRGRISDDNLLDSMLSYLIKKGEYKPSQEKTFSPAICNRLDRNSSGIIIGAKNSSSLQLINEALRNRRIGRFYKTIVKGDLNEDFQAEGYLSRDRKKQKVDISRQEEEGKKKVSTRIRPLESNKEFSLLEIELITGRYHQIRGQLASLGHPIIGDRKYGDKDINSRLRKEYGLGDQWLHAYKIEFNNLEGILSYLNGRAFFAEIDEEKRKIEKGLFMLREG